VLRWLEKLRNWQTKYNPINAPMPWTDLELKHLEHVKAESSLKAMGSTCFLFRDAAGQGNDRFKPIVANSVLDGFWYKLLQTLEKPVRCELRCLIFRAIHWFFVQPDPFEDHLLPAAFLRVSLITAMRWKEACRWRFCPSACRSRTSHHDALLHERPASPIVRRPWMRPPSA